MVLVHLRVIVGFSSCYACSSHSKSSIKTTVLTDAQDAVMDRLKSPSSVNFPIGNYTVTDNGDDSYIVTGEVDAENSFGAKIRSKYSCTVNLTNALLRWLKFKIRSKYSCTVKGEDGSGNGTVSDLSINGNSYDDTSSSSNDSNNNDSSLNDSSNDSSDSDSN